ncbi:hypothetical protein ACETAC_03945 [Aceticella autotrophica]|uniref:Uncharacterized protein n=1 Tax=Aceticella autotrophica TaxID=2755338 RepID=A0A975AX28_9THEO|nr:hypothetical protein [Aceticella autotrophica]QSZ28019.1 hypothetical protein ACETAC_03945 [Aceticella autotrophica]
MDDNVDLHLNKLYGVLQGLKKNIVEDDKEKKSSDEIIEITPSGLLVILGLLLGVLTPESVIVDRNQCVQIVLMGSLKKKTDIGEMLKNANVISFDDMMKFLIKNAE